MCGLVGFIEKNHNINSLDMDLFEELLHVNALRGRDSTGAFTAYQSGNAYLAKVATNPLNFIDTTAYDKFRTKATRNGCFVAGHNRKATIGSITSENAHPFHEEKIVLMHNGTLTNWNSLDSTAKVDSQAVARALNTKTIEEVIKSIYGAYAFIWYDGRTKKLNFLRNSERPMFYIETQFHYLWSSEVEIAEMVLDRNKVKVIAVKEAEPHVMLSYDLKERKFSYKKVAPATYSQSNFQKSAPSTANTPPASSVTTIFDVKDKDEEEDASLNEALEVVEAAKASSKIVGMDGKPISLGKPTFKPVKGAWIYHTITGVRTDPSNSKIKIQGKLHSALMPNADVIGFVSETDLEVANDRYKKQKYYMSRIKEVGEPVCGMTCWITDTREALEGEDHDGNIVCLPAMRQYLLASHDADRCMTCGKGSIIADDIPFSRVFTNPDVSGINRYKIMCPDCIEQGIKDEADKEKFVQSYVDALQARKQELLDIGGHMH